ATVSYIMVELPNINGTLPPNGTDGWYMLNLNSTEFANNGTYTLNINAIRQYYEPKSITIPIIINQILTNFTIDKANVEVYWMENITLNGYYEDISAKPYIPITGATVNYSIVELPNINGTLQPNNTKGFYILQLKLNNTDLIANINYNLKISANKKGCETNTIYINLKVLTRPTLVNGKSQIQNVIYNIKFGEMSNFTISYIDEILNEKIIALDDKSYIWKKYNEDNKLIKQGVENLILNRENLYVLDSKDFRNFVGTITFDITLYKLNYEEKEITLTYNIEENELSYTLGAAFNGETIEMEKDTPKKIRIELFIPSRGNAPLTGARVTLKIGTKHYDFTEIEEGIYELDYKQEETQDTFFKAKVIDAVIQIFKYGYEYTDIKIEIIIKREEIFPGIPKFYFFLFSGAIISVIGILITDKLIRAKVFTKFVKKLKGKKI
ncbi:MAG: hypothetical protein ACFFDN_21835, partial [Candidatus Hodarchaeota archaeon]